MSRTQSQTLAQGVNTALFQLRLAFGIPLLTHHGLPLLRDFEHASHNFLPLFGLSSEFSFVLALLGQVACPLLVILGLWTRIAATGATFAMAVAFGLVHGATFAGEQSGELPYLYMSAFAAVAVAGPGRFAIDAAPK